MFKKGKNSSELQRAQKYFFKQQKEFWKQYGNEVDCPILYKFIGKNVSLHPMEFAPKYE